MRVDVERLWDVLELPGERVPLVTEGEVRAAVMLLRRLGELDDGAAGLAAGELAGRLARRVPS